MKNYIKKLLMLSLLSTSIVSLSMEELSDNESIEIAPNLEELFLDDLGLPNEMWAKILSYVYDSCFNLTILDEAKDIYEAIDIIEERISKCLQTMPLVCKTFKNLSISKKQWNEFRKKIREFYIPYLNERFLEEREGKKGFCPKSGEWDSDASINNEIAQFIARTEINILIDKIVKARNLIILKVLLFYGANPNIKDRCGETTLHRAVFNHYLPTNLNNIEIITLLLEHGANPNIQSMDGLSPLHIAAANNFKNIAILLLQHSANPKIKNYYGVTAFDIAREKNLTDFEHLVRIHSQNTLKKICLQYILTNLSLFENQLDTLPIELQDTINNLKS